MRISFTPLLAGELVDVLRLLVVEPPLVRGKRLLAELARVHLDVELLGVLLRLVVLELGAAVADLGAQLARNCQ